MAFGSKTTITEM
jgi:hypothetical protein